MREVCENLREGFVKVGPVQVTLRPGLGTPKPRSAGVGRPGIEPGTRGLKVRVRGVRGGPWKYEIAGHSLAASWADGQERPRTAPTGHHAGTICKIENHGICRSAAVEQRCCLAAACRRSKRAPWLLLLAAVSQRRSPSSAVVSSPTTGPDDGDAGRNPLGARRIPGTACRRDSGC